jgi:hypothetical protein
MFRKGLSVLILVVLLLGLVPGVAFAQGPDVYCGDLSEADCNLLLQSEQAMREITSSAFDLNAEFSMSSSEEFAPDVTSVTFSVSGNGAVAADLGALGDFQGMDPEQAMAMMDTLPQMLVDFLRGLSGEATLNLVLPAALMDEAPIPSDLTLNLVGVDGVLYVDLRSLLPASVVEEEGMPAWIGIDLAGMYETLFNEMPNMDMEEMQGMFDASGLAGLMYVELFSKYFSVERGEDQTVEGQTVAVFTTTIDYAGIANDPEFQQAMDQYMQTVLEMQGESMEDLPIDMHEVMAATMSGIQFSMEQWIGLDDTLVHHTAMDMSFALDREAIAALEGNQSDMQDVPEFSMAFNATVNLSNFDEPVDVTAPEGAQVINPMMMMPDMAPANGGTK